MYIQKQYDRHHEIVLWASFVVSLSALFGVIGSGDSLRMMVAFTLLVLFQRLVCNSFFVTSCLLRCYGCDIWDSIGADWYNTIQY